MNSYFSFLLGRKLCPSPLNDVVSFSTCLFAPTGTILYPKNNLPNGKFNGAGILSFSPVSFNFSVNVLFELEAVDEDAFIAFPFKRCPHPWNAENPFVSVGASSILILLAYRFK